MDSKSNTGLPNKIGNIELNCLLADFDGSPCKLIKSWASIFGSIDSKSRDKR